ncbi:MAG: PilZ domain-containing protein [Acidobacteria bacterium]|nr:PilZ domain-containing protein [Acidobacteriota bacterium]
MEGQKNYRRYGRVVIPEDKLMPCMGTSKELSGQVSIVGLGGMFIRTKDVLPTGTVFAARFSFEDITVQTDCAVRYTNERGVGVEFVRLRGINTDSLQKILVRLKIAEQTESFVQ